MEKNVKSMRNYTIIGIIITIIAFVFTIIVYLVQRSSGKTTITAQVISNDELTLYAPEAELNARFTYAGEDVAHLWKVEVRFLNSGYKTIIGKGNLKNIIPDDGLNFEFKDNTRILRMQKKDENIETKLIQNGKNKFQIQFLQWRANEYTSACFYLASEEVLSEKPLPAIVNREIVDGEVVIEDVTKQTGKKNIYIIESVFKNYAIYFKIFGGMLAGILIIALFFVITAGWVDYSKCYMWKKKYHQKYKKYISGLNFRSKLQKETYLNNPEVCASEYWDRFEGKKYPKTSVDFATAKEAIQISAAMILVVIGCLILLLSIIPA